MKFEIDPNELTTDQRAHVAAFITNWPTSIGEVDLYVPKIRSAEEVEKSILNCGGSFDQGITTPITEEQRLDADQKSDLSPADECRKLGLQIAADNLNAIFGTPELGAKVDSLVPLDKEGLPWDSRIHASTKTLIADGSWKLRRGVDPTDVEKLKAQLKDLMAVPIPPIAIEKEMVEQYADEKSLRNEMIGAGAVPVPPVKSNYLIDQQPMPVTLTELIGRMSAAIAAGKLTQANVTEMCVKHGVSEFHLLSNRPDLLPLIDADMKSMEV